MISSFTAKNYRSIVETTVRFDYGEKKAPNGYREMDRWAFLDDGHGGRFVPCLAMFGANAAGKSNLLRAVDIFKKIVCDPHADARQLYNPNKLAGDSAATTFRMDFESEGRNYSYGLVYGGDGIAAEVLSCAGSELYHVAYLSGSFKGLTAGSDAYDEKRIAEILKVECSDGNGHQTAPLLGRLGTSYQGLCKVATDAFRFIRHKIEVRFSFSVPDILPWAVERLANALEVTPETALDRIVDVVRKLDVDIRSIRITENKAEDASSPLFAETKKIVRVDEKTGGEVPVLIHSVHRDWKGNEVLFRFMEEESEGTQRLAILVALFLCAIKRGHAIFIDELDRSIHPLLLRELLRIFQTKAYNDSNAQLVFTTQNTDILDNEVLRLSEVGIVGKNTANGTQIQRLSDLRDAGEDIRNVTDFRSQYLKGLYSGVPHPAL